MDKVYDLVILGAGPAGITAAVYAARKKIDCVVITLDIGGQTAWSGDIENYTGYQFITGGDLTLKFQEHMNVFGIKTNMPEEVKEIKQEESIIKTITDKQEYFSKTLIVATGKRPRLLGVSGEKEFKNKGVTYCATCDGPIFKDKAVAIIGGGNSGLEAALQMAKISPKVYLIERGPHLNGDAVMVEKLEQSSNVEIHTGTSIKKIYGDDFVKGIELEKEYKVFNADVDGVFVEVGLFPNSEFADILKKNEKQEVIIDCYNKTNVEGIFAAGDVTNVPEKQIIIACGEGSKASLAAFKYLSKLKP